MKKRILHGLAKHGPSTVIDLSAHLDEHPITVDRVCFSLEQDGLVELSAHGTYRISDRGRCHISTDQPAPKGTDED